MMTRLPKNKNYTKKILENLEPLETWKSTLEKLKILWGIEYVQTKSALGWIHLNLIYPKFGFFFTPNCQRLQHFFFSCLSFFVLCWIMRQIANFTTDNKQRKKNPPKKTFISNIDILIFFFSFFCLFTLQFPPSWLKVNLFISPSGLISYTEIYVWIEIYYRDTNHRLLT